MSPMSSINSPNSLIGEPGESFDEDELLNPASTSTSTPTSAISSITSLKNVFKDQNDNKNGNENNEKKSSVNGYEYSKLLYNLSEQTSVHNKQELAMSIHQMCLQLKQCSTNGQTENEKDSNVSTIIRLLATSCSELSHDLKKLEFELKRLEWRKPISANNNNNNINSDSDSITSNIEIKKENKKNKKNKMEPLQLDGGNTSSSSSSAITNQSTSSSSIQPSMNQLSTTGTGFATPIEEELWVLDQLDGILAHSRTAPGIFWGLLEERQIALGMKSDSEAGLWQDNPWQLATLGLLLLCAVGCFWAIPAIYQRWGSPFLLGAAIFLQFPMVVAGPFFWAEARTCTLGGIIVTLGACLTSLTVLGIQAVALGLGFFKGKSRDWFPEPISYLQNRTEFPYNSQWLFGSTAFICLFSFLLTADVPFLSFPFVICLRMAIVYSPTFRYFELLLNHYVVGPGKLGLYQADIWIDFLLGLSLLCLFISLLLLSWIFAPIIHEGVGNTHSSSSLSSSNDHTQNLALTNNQNNNQNNMLVNVHDQDDGQGDGQDVDPVDVFTKKRNRARYREFLFIGCDASILLFWISFSRLDKSHSQELEIIYGIFNCFLIVLSLLTKRKALLVGLFGLAWYQGYRAVDVFNRSKHYAQSLLLYDDFCVLIHCVDPLKNRPDHW